MKKSVPSNRFQMNLRTIEDNIAQIRRAAIQALKNASTQEEYDTIVRRLRGFSLMVEIELQYLRKVIETIPRPPNQEPDTPF